MIKKITDDVIYAGVTDRRTDLFEGQYQIPDGISYNSYVILDEKTAVMDTVGSGFADEWLANVSEALDGRKPDYLVVHHMEPDHSSNIRRFMEVYPEAVVAANPKAFAMMDNFFGIDTSGRRIDAADGGKLELGKHTLTFMFAPMVHWPEVMMSWDSADGILFSADAFGRFGAPDGGIDWDDEARRYYIGIVGKYGVQVQTVLKKAAALDIKAICPLHGPVLTDTAAHCIEKYDVWSSYRPETEGVMIAYTSIYGNTRRAAELLAEKLKAAGCPEAPVYDLARTDIAEATAQAFRYSKLALATTTYNGDIFPYMRQFIDHLTERGYRGRMVGLIENGSWAPVAAKKMKDMLAGCRDIVWADTTVTIKSGLKPENEKQLDALAGELCR